MGKRLIFAFLRMKFNILIEKMTLFLKMEHFTYEKAIAHFNSLEEYIAKCRTVSRKSKEKFITLIQQLFTKAASLQYKLWPISLGKKS